MFRTLLSLVTLLALNASANAMADGQNDAGQIPVVDPITVVADDEREMMRVIIAGAPAKLLFDSLTTARMTTGTTATGTVERRQGPHFICGKFMPTADQTGASDEYRCGHLITSDGQSVADGIDPMIGVGG